MADAPLVDVAFVPGTPCPAGDSYIGSWVQRRDGFAAAAGFRTATLHKALSAGARYRYVSLIEWSDTGTAAVPAAVAGDAHRRYRLAVHDVSQPPRRGDIVVANPIEAPVAADPPFVRQWCGGLERLRSQPGFVLARLLVAEDAQTIFGFVALTRWRSPEAFRAALGSPAVRAAPPPPPYRNFPALYRQLET